MPTTITSAGVTFNDNTTITTAPNLSALPGTVGTSQIADSAITSAKIADGAVATADIADGAVNLQKLASLTQLRVAKAWVNFNGATIASDYTTGNTVTYAAGSSTTLVTVTRVSHSVSVGDWITVSGVTGATAVNGTFQVTAITSTTFQYIVNSVVTGTVGGTAVVRVTTIRSSLNVSSITKNGTGDYTINFATAMTDANYSYVGSSRYNRDDTTGYAPALYSFLSDTKTTLSVRVRSYTAYQAVQDSSEVNLLVFGN